MNRTKRAIWVIWLMVALVVLGVAAAVAAIVNAEKRDAIAATSRQAETIARSAETTLNRNLLGLDLMLAGLQQMPGLLRPEGNVVDLAQVSEGLSLRVNQSLIARDLVLVNRQGQVVAAADSATRRLGVELPADFLASVFAQPVSELVVSTPFTSAATAEKSLYLARPLGLAQQSDLVALAEVPVATLTTIMTSGVAIEGLTVTLEDDQGRLLASAPASDSMLGERNPRSLPSLLENPEQTGKTHREAGRVDGAPAYLAIRPSLYRTVLVSAGISEAASLARSHNSGEQAMLVGGGFALLAVIIALLVQSSLVRMARASAETAEAKLVLEEALASMDEGFLLWDADDRVVSWNFRYLDMFPHMHGTIAVGATLQAISEVGVRAHFPEADAGEREALNTKRIAQHYSDGRDFELRLLDGRTVSVVERRTANGGIVSVYRDITRAKAAANELVAARQVAEAGSEAKTRFLATMSHEIRTPLNGVLGMNGLLLETQLDVRQRRYAETIRMSGEALLDILNDVLDTSKLEAGRMTLELAPFDPALLLEEVVSLLRPHAEAKSISLGISISTALPPLLGDCGRLRQILFNLIGNAVKFTQRGGVMVRAASHSLGNGIVEWALTVSDTGVGIPEDALPTLFERFTQADNSTSRRFGGTGLGLAICRQLAELMDGRVEVSSRVGEGSDFMLSVPLLLAPSQELDAPEPSLDPPAPRAGNRPLRILVAEDNRVNQMLLLAMLERLGHHTDVVCDGREALRQVQQGQYDMVLMDIQMPEMDGAAATREIRKLPEPWRGIPIIAVSANVLPEQREAYLAVGMNGHLAKPFNREQLEAAIAEQMTRVFDEARDEEHG